MDITGVNGELADQLAALRRTWSATTTDQPGEAVTYDDLAAEYQTMVDAWFAEIGTHLEVLEELCVAVHDPAG
jgi:hypothetical protein